MKARRSATPAFSTTARSICSSCIPWNAAIYVAQIEDARLGAALGEGAYLDATREVLQDNNGLWFYDESYMVSRKRN